MAYWIFLHLKMYKLTQYVIFAFISYPSYQNTVVLLLLFFNGSKHAIDKGFTWRVDPLMASPLVRVIKSVL